jgi:hypothetical protein
MATTRHVVLASFVESNNKIVVAACQNGELGIGHCPHLDFVIVFDRGLHGVAAKVGTNVNSDGKAYFIIGPLRTCEVFEILMGDHHATIMH